MTETYRTAYVLKQAFMELDIPELKAALEGYDDNVELPCGSVLVEDGTLYLWVESPR
jgi:hypothetical protein